MTAVELSQSEQLLNDSEREHLIRTVQSRVLADIGQLDLEPSLNSDLLSPSYVKRLTFEVLDECFHGISFNDRLALARFVHDHICGLGPLEPLLRDSAITDIFIEDTRIITTKKGERFPASESFRSLDEVRNVVDRITSPVGKRVDVSNPVCDCELHDGSRCHIIFPPIADRIYVTIRKLGCMDLELDDWVAAEVLPQHQAAYLDAAVCSRKNILISGGTGAGKTTLLNTLSKTINKNQLIVTLEDTYELRLPHPCVRRLITREPIVEGAVRVTFSELLKNALRMNPDRLIMGEVRDESAYDLLHALNIGHKGSLTTIHANSVHDALWRLETLALAGAPDVSLPVLRRQIARVVDVVVQLRGIDTNVDVPTKRQIVEIAYVNDTLAADGGYSIEMTYGRGSYD